MREEILAYIRKNGDASFANLDRLLGERCKGDLCWEFGNNVILWFGMSHEFCETLREMKLKGEIEIVPCQPLIYLIDGAFPNAPIAKRPTSKGYKKEHWLPVVFHLGKAA
jgi:hypothetical protein